MTDCVNAEHNRVQAPHCKPMINGVFSNPTLKQLPPSNDPVLPSRQICNEDIGAFAKPPQPAYFAG